MQNTSHGETLPKNIKMFIRAHRNSDLGHMVLADGVKVDSGKTAAIAALQAPTCREELRCLYVTLLKSHSTLA